MIKIKVWEAKDVPTCGDGCCHDDGLMIEKIIDGKSDDYFIPTRNEDENDKILELLQFLYSRENVKLKK